MITDQEYNALVCVLRRVPLTDAEVPTIQAIIAKLQPKPPEEVPK